jgi:hypothetical protein
MDKKVVALTKAEADLWDWAVDAVNDYWQDAGEREYEGAAVYDEAMRAAHGSGVGLIVDDPQVAEDLLYRIEEQMSCILDGDCDTSRGGLLSQRKAARSLARKIRAAFNLTMEG